MERPIDGSTEAFKKDHPEAGADDSTGSLFDRADAATDAFLGIHGQSDDAGGPPDSDTDSGAADSDGSATDQASDATAFEAGVERAIKGRGRGKLAAV